MRPNWQTLASLTQKTKLGTKAVFNFISVFIALKGHSF